MAIEINDAGIIAVDDFATGTPRAPASPGYALFDGDRLLTGLEAEARARLKPRWVHDHFWRDLSTAPLPRPFPDSLTTADLVHAHLADVWSTVGDGVDTVILAVPGSHDDKQLGLILGIARACGAPVSGIVDAAVAASAAGYPGERLLHLDLQRHRTVATALHQGTEIARAQVEVADLPGLARLHDRWARHIAAMFVRKTRFDPLHSATTEQALFSGLAGWLEGLRDDDLTIVSLPGGDDDYTVEIARADLVAVVDDDLARIERLVSPRRSTGVPLTVLLSHRAASLPGLESRLAAIEGVRVIALAPEAATAGALRHAGRIRAAGEELPFVVRLPSGKATAPPPVAVPPAATGATMSLGEPPTHLLLDGKAYPVTVEPLVVGVAVPAGGRGLNLSRPAAGIAESHCSIYRTGNEVVVDNHSAHGSFVNGERVDRRRVLAAGDRLRLGTPGVELEMITVVNERGTPPD
ncbi:MAG: FHA domain-containing protein [Acidobacteriota bacterium]|nr:FHA domain-containing protein [Acidobacteriota bacterium]